jgi:hypothetical protein
MSHSPSQLVLQINWLILSFSLGPVAKKMAVTKAGCDRPFGTASRLVDAELPVDQAHLSDHACTRIPAARLPLRNIRLSSKPRSAG